MKKKAMYGIAALAVLGMLALGFTAAVSASAENTAPACKNMESAPDADGDGIPNGMDSDFERPMDGTGQMHQYRGAGGHGHMNGECNGEGKMYRHGYRYQNQESGVSAP